MIRKLLLTYLFSRLLVRWRTSKAALCNLLFEKKEQISIGGVKIPCNDLNLDRFEENLIRRSRYLEYERVALEATLSADDVVLSLNCGWGYLPVVAAMRLESDENVFCFEGNEKVLNSVSRMFEVNGIKPKFFNQYVGQETNIVELQFESNFWSNDFMNLEERPIEKVSISVQGIDDVIGKLEVPPNYLLFEVNYRTVSILSSDCIDSFEKMLIVSRRYRELKPYLESLENRSWSIKEWPINAYYCENLGRSVHE